ncbi:SpoIIE family protein phosphatase [Streptomyces sp. NRRL WC-3618]|uniref:SpoIIE family protein phosphatase n=1 Tax=Streptomyces sp. NRRL WC-3618 TaxID=1519490 RepID=UPI000B1718BE|nr:SpoIIE family protein phosphatase [Streptomyces sp. NRRL WC-3618]
MGHDIDAALAATVLVGTLRGARLAGAGLAEQAHLADHNRGHATGQLLRLNLHTGRSQLANAGHPLATAHVRGSGGDGHLRGGPSLRAVRARTPPLPRPGPRSGDLCSC